MQARLQLEALTLVRPIRAARIWARRAAAAETLAADVKSRLGIEALALTDPCEAVRGVDIVVTTTPATEPILKAEWLSAGQHVTAMGSDAEHKNEIDPAAIARAVYVADSLAQTRRLGELHHALAAGSIAPDRTFAEIGEVIAGAAPGRRAPDDITIAI